MTSAGDLRPHIVEGARLFDDRQFFAAHEAWEARWTVETDPSTRLLLQGLIQIAAGFHKLVDKQDPESAARLLGRGLAKLDACPDGVAALDLTVFREAVRSAAGRLRPKSAASRDVEPPKMFG